MILMEFLFAPTVPSPPRPQNLHSMVPSAAVFGQFLSSGRRVRHVIDDADGELTLGLRLGKLGVNSEHGSGRGVLGAETVTAADDGLVGDAGVGQRGDDVEIEGLALCAGLLGAVEDRDLLAVAGMASIRRSALNGRYRRTLMRPTFSPWALR